MKVNELVLSETIDTLNDPEFPGTYGEYDRKDIDTYLNDIDFLKNMKSDFEYDLEHHIKPDFSESVKEFEEAIKWLEERIKKIEY